MTQENKRPSAISLNQAKLALGVLFLIGVMNYVDRATMSVLQVPIKDDLGFTDTQLGTLTGLAFFIPFMVLSIPVARLADTRSRRMILLVALVLWSAMTALLGQADSFALMIVLRMGVAIGEACCLPAAYSLISDYFRPKHRGRAVAVFGTAYPVGSLVGLATIGVLGTWLGWRTTFMAVGCAGFLLVPLLLLFLPEPARGATDDTPADDTAPAVLTAVRSIFAIRSFRYALIGLGMQALTGYAIVIWSAPYYTRAFDLNLAETGLILGVVLGVGGGASVYLGGYLADRLGQRDSSWYLKLCAAASALFIPFSFAQFLAPNLWLSLSAGFVSALFATVFLAPVNVVGQLLVAPRLRALIAGVITTVSALAGGSLGPLLVGWMSDRALDATGGDDAAALRIAMLVTISLSLIAVFAFLRGARYVGADIEARRATPGSTAETT